MTAIVKAAPETAEVLGLEPEQTRAAILLASGMPIGKVAIEIGVDRRTLFQWRQSAGFTFAFERELAVQNQLVREATHARMLGLAEKALDVVEDALKAGGPGALAAARIVLGRADAPEIKALPIGEMPAGARADISTPELISRAIEIRRLASGTR